MPGDGSSSPSADRESTTGNGRVGPAEAPVTILSVELKGAGGEAVTIHLSDGSRFVLHAETWARAGLSSGDPLDPETLSRLLTVSERIFARRRALALISRSTQTRLGLARKLAARGFSAAAIRHAVSRMIRLGYLNDRAFAESWLHSRLASRSDGWKSLYRGLIGRGVPRSLASEVTTALYTPQEEAARARRLVRGLAPASAVRRLSLRGFRSRTIALVLREIRTGRPAGEDGPETDRPPPEE